MSLLPYGNSSAGVLGLQVPDRRLASSERMLGFVLGEEGTAMLRARDVNHGNIYQVTGQAFRLNGLCGDGIISVEGRESQAKTTRAAVSDVLILIFLLFASRDYTLVETPRSVQKMS